MPPAALTASYMALAALGTSLKSAGPVTVEIAPSLIGPSGQVGPAARTEPEHRVVPRPHASTNAIFNDILVPSTHNILDSQTACLRSRATSIAANFDNVFSMSVRGMPRVMKTRRVRRSTPGHAVRVCGG